MPAAAARRRGGGRGLRHVRPLLGHVPPRHGAPLHHGGPLLQVVRDQLGRRRVALDGVGGGGGRGIRVAARDVGGVAGTPAGILRYIIESAVKCEMVGLAMACICTEMANKECYVLLSNRQAKPSRNFFKPCTKSEPH